MKYDIVIVIDQDTGSMIGVIVDENGKTVSVSGDNYTLDSVINWIVTNLRSLNPEGPCSATRKKVYNDRVIGRPGFWEITTYNAKGEQLRSGQWSDIMEEGYLRGLIQDQFGFPLEAAEEIE